MVHPMRSWALAILLTVGAPSAVPGTWEDLGIFSVNWYMDRWTYSGWTGGWKKRREEGKRAGQICFEKGFRVAQWVKHLT